MLDAYYPFYQNMVINDHDGDASVEESIEGGPTSFVIQVSEVLQETVYLRKSCLCSCASCSQSVPHERGFEIL